MLLELDERVTGALLLAGLAARHARRIADCSPPHLPDRPHGAGVRRGCGLRRRISRSRHRRRRSVQGFTSEFTPRFGVDGLSGLFLGALGLVAAAALVFSRDYLEPDGRGRTVAALTALLVLVLAGVFCARDPLTFLTGWELMTLVPGDRDPGRSQRRPGCAHEPSSSTWP